MQAENRDTQRNDEFPVPEGAAYRADQHKSDDLSDDHQPKPAESGSVFDCAFRHFAGQSQQLSQYSDADRDEQDGDRGADEKQAPCRAGADYPQGRQKECGAYRDHPNRRTDQTENPRSRRGHAVLP
jgi:hypothetical protein